MTKIVCLWISYESVKEASFKICQCGCGRCSIFFKIGCVHPDVLKNKKQSLDTLIGLEEKNYISHEESIKVKSEIENSTRPSG